MKMPKAREFLFVLCLAAILLPVLLVTGHYLKSPEQRVRLIETEVAQGRFEEAYWHARWIVSWHGGDEEFRDAYPRFMAALARSERCEEAVKNLLEEEESARLRADLVNLLKRRGAAEPQRTTGVADHGDGREE